jgi:hypothetical protein
LNRIKGIFSKIQYYVNHYNDVELGSIHDFSNKNLGNVPINPDNLAAKMRLQQQIRADEQIADYTNRVADGLQEAQIQLAMWPFGIIASGADDILRSAHSIRKWVTPTTKAIKSISDMLSDDVIQGLRSGMKRIDLSNSKLKGEIFEEFLAKSLGGIRDVKVGGHQYDVQVGNILIEAKSGLTAAMKDFSKLKSDTMSHHTIAIANGKEYIFVSVEKIPRELRKYLESKKIKYLDLSE